MKINNTDIDKIIDKINNKSFDKIPACGYCRFSSDHQREESIEAQQRIILDYAERNGYEIIEWYIDRAFSGKTVKRPDFQRMLNTIGTQECSFKAVIIHKMDRFSRNAADALTYKNLLKDYGIDLVSTVERIKDDANGRLLYGIMSNINQYYIDNLSNEVVKGMKENAYKCIWNGGKPPLGYSVDPETKKLIIDEDEAIIVRKIFQMASEGCGYNTIIKELNACGYTTKAGNPFGKNSLYDLIGNERYYGVYIFNKRAKRSSTNTRNMRKFKDESEIIRIENGNPAIISKDLWLRANISRKTSSKLATNAKHTYILSGLLKCGECGAKMHGNHRHGSTKSYRTYRCNKQSNQLNCACKEIHGDVLESFVIDNLLKHFFDDEVIDIITEQVNNKIKELTHKDTEMVTEAKNSLKGLQLAKNNLIEAIAHTGYNQTITDKINSLEKQISQYQSVINNHEQNKDVIKITKDEVISKISNLREEMYSKKNIEQTKLLLHSYIEQIVVDNHSVKVTYKVAFFICLDNEDVEIHYNHTVIEARKHIEKTTNRVSRNSQNQTEHRKIADFVSVGADP